MGIGMSRLISTTWTILGGFKIVESRGLGDIPSSKVNDWLCFGGFWPCSDLVS